MAYLPGNTSSKRGPKTSESVPSQRTVDVLLHSPVKQHIKAVHTTSQFGMK